MTRLTDVLMRARARDQQKNLKKFYGHKKVFALTRVTTQQYLSNKVMERKVKVNSGGMCLADMQVLLDCMKLNEFGENTCMAEMAKHKACLEKEKKYVDELKAMTTSADLGDEESRLNTKQVNKLLSMFPNPSPRFIITHANKWKLKDPLVLKYDRDEPWALPETMKKKKS